LSLLEKLGFDLFIITNQSGVGRGYFNLESVYTVHRQLQNDLRQLKLKPFVDFGICPHAPHDQCECRKPSGKMIIDMINKYAIDPQKSYMVGDKLIDAEAGENAGIQGIVVRGKSHGHFPHFSTLLDFAQSLKEK